MGQPYPSRITIRTDGGELASHLVLPILEGTLGGVEPTVVYRPAHSFRSSRTQLGDRQITGLVEPSFSLRILDSSFAISTSTKRIFNHVRQPCRTRGEAAHKSS